MGFPPSGGGGSSSPGFEIGYDEITSNATIASTSEAAPTTLITCAAHVFDGTPVLLTVFSTRLLCDTSTIGNLVGLSLWEGASELGILGLFRTDQITTQDYHPLVLMYRFTPTAGSHTYLIRGWASSTTGNPGIAAGLGGTGAAVAAFARFTKV